MLKKEHEIVSIMFFFFVYYSTWVVLAMGQCHEQAKRSLKEKSCLQGILIIEAQNEVKCIKETLIKIIRNKWFVFDWDNHNEAKSQK